MWRRATLVCALVALADATVHACPICFQVEDANAVNGVRAAVAVLIGVTGAVLVGFAGFALRLARNQSSTEPGNPAPRTPEPDARTLNPGTEELRNRP
jgi:hypothetical protein